jgi:hypothetical protein
VTTQAHHPTAVSTNEEGLLAYESLLPQERHQIFEIIVISNSNIIIITRRSSVGGKEETLLS